MSLGRDQLFNCLEGMGCINVKKRRLERMGPETVMAFKSTVSAHRCLPSSLEDCLGDLLPISSLLCSKGHCVLQEKASPLKRCIQEMLNEITKPLSTRIRELEKEQEEQKHLLQEQRHLLQEQKHLLQTAKAALQECEVLLLSLARSLHLLESQCAVEVAVHVREPMSMLLDRVWTPSRSVNACITEWKFECLKHLHLSLQAWAARRGRQRDHMRAEALSLLQLPEHPS